MTRGTLITLALLAAGCSGPPPQGVTAPPTAGAPAPAPPPAEAGPLFTAEAAPDLNVEPVPAGQSTSPYSYPGSYKPLHHGPTPAPTPIPVLPTRKPARILGDRRFLAPGSGSGCVALSPDGKRLALGTCVFDTAGELDAAHDAAGNGVHKLAFSPDGTRLYCGEGPYTNVPTHGKMLAVRDVPGKRRLLHIPMHDWGLSGDGGLLVTLESVGYTPNAAEGGQRGMMAHSYPAVRIYDTKTWKGVAGYRVRGTQPTAVALSPDGARVVLGCDDGAVRVWDRAAGKEVATLRDLCEAADPNGRQPCAHLIAFSPDGKTLAAAAAWPFGDGPCRVAWWTWPGGGRLQLKSSTALGDPTSLQFSPDSKFVFVGHALGANVWDAASGEVRGELDLHKHKRSASTIAFAAADRVYAPNGRPALLAFPSLEPLPWPAKPFEPTPPAPDFAMAEPMPPKIKPDGPDGVDLPGGGRVRALRPFSEREAGFEHTDASGERVRHYDAGRTGRYAVSRDGKLLVTCATARGINSGASNQADWEAPVKFWELATGKELGAIRVYPEADPYRDLRLSPDGKQLALAHADGLVRVWDVATRKPVVALDAGGYWFDRFEFSADGKWLVGGSARLPVMAVWDATAPAPAP